MGSSKFPHTVTRNLVHLPDVVAVAGAIAVFITAGITNISNESLIQVTCGILALLSMSLLIIRVTKLDKIDDVLESIDGPLIDRIDEQQRELHELTKFLTAGALEVKLLEATTTANGYRHDFERTGLTAAYATLAEVDLAEEMRHARKSIRIIASWTGCLISLGETLVERSQAGCDVRILILQHNSEFARLRGLELDPGNERAVTRQIATEMCEFNRLFRQHPELRHLLQVRAFDARPPMCMFAHDDVRLVGSLWPSINAMDAPAVRVVGDGDASLVTSLGKIADREFERLWADEKTRYVTVVDGEPRYTELAEMAWSVDGQRFPSVLEDLECAAREGGDRGRQRVVQAIRSDPEKVHVAVLELHECLRSKDVLRASKIIDMLEEIGLLRHAEVVLQEAVNCGYMQYLEKLVQLQFRAGNAADAERTLRRAVSTGNYYAIFRLIKLLDSTGRASEVEHVLRDGAEAGSPDALRSLVDLLDRSNRSFEADRVLKQKNADGFRFAGHMLAIREFRNGNTEDALSRLREWAKDGDVVAQDIENKLDYTLVDVRDANRGTDGGHADARGSA